MVIDCTSQEISDLLDKIFEKLREKPLKSRVLK